MGISVMIVTLEGYQEHPDWEWGGISGDKEASDIICSLPRTEKMSRDEWYIRPTDFTAWREAQWPEWNEWRWPLMIDILERDDRYWISFSF